MKRSAPASNYGDKGPSSLHRPNAKSEATELLAQGDAGRRERPAQMKIEDMLDISLPEISLLTTAE